MAQMKESNLPAWDLSDLYNGIDDPKINKDLEKIRKLNLKLAKDYKGKIASLSPAEFLKAGKLCEEMDIIESALGNFAYLNMVTRMNNKDAMAFYQNVSEKLTDYSKPGIFFSLEINHHANEKF